MTISTVSTPVLIIGAGPAGLTAGLSLAAHGTKSIILEQRSAISEHPRAIGFTATTLEVFRSFGIGEDEIASAPENFKLVRRRVQSMAGKHYEDTQWNSGKPGGKPNEQQQQQKRKPATPCSYVRGAAQAQDKVEAALTRRAKEAGVEIRMSHVVQSVSQDEHGVRATVLDQTSGTTLTFTAHYLIAADGHRSPTREQLGIQRQGRGYIRTLRSVLFRSTYMDKYLASGAHQFSFEEPDFDAFMTTYGDSRWVLMFSDDKERTHEELDAAIVRAAGEPDFERTIITTGRWQLGALVANTFQQGRIFLAGDAAHQLPPNRGGYGANTGVADALNLAWKLAHVVQGKANPQLLDTYDAERRPIAWLRIQQIFAREDFKKFAEGFANDVKIIDDDAMEFGQRLLSVQEAARDDQTTMIATDARHPNEWKAARGTRLPHILVQKTESASAQEPISLLQLGHQEGLAHAWKIITTDKLEAEELADVQAHGVPIFIATLGENLFDTQNQSRQSIVEAVGLDNREEQTILVRPDGHVAWRGTSNSVAKGLRHALTLQ